MIKQSLISPFLVLIGLLLCNSSIFAQELFQVRGQIYNSSKQPIEFAHVTLFGADSTQAATMSTDSLGRFDLRLAQGQYQFLIEQYGAELYRDSVELYNDLDLGELIVNESIALDEITITGKRKIIERQFDKLIFNVESSPLKEGYDGMEVLKRSPKVTVNSQGEIVLRNANALILINGRKTSLSSEELSNYLSAMNSSNIRSIEIQDVGSAETEASNSGGVVNIILKKQPTGFQSTARASYGYRNAKNGIFNGGLATEFGSDKWNIYNKINYRNDRNTSKATSTTSFYKSNGKNVTESNSGQDADNFNITTGLVYYPNKKHQFGTEIYYSSTTTDRNGLSNLQVYDPSLTAVADNYSIVDNKTEFWNITGNYSYVLDSLGSKLKFIGDFGKNDIDNLNEVDTRYSLGDIANNHNRYDTDASSAFYNAQIDWLQKFNSTNTLSVGTKISNVTRENTLHRQLFTDQWQDTPTGQENFHNSEYIWASYADYAIKINNKHQLKGGLRIEYTHLEGEDKIQQTTIKKNYLDFFPSLFYGYDIDENQNVTFSYSRRIQRPSFRDLNPFVIKQNDFLYQIGNPELQPQYTNKLDLTYNRKKHSFSLFGDLTKDLIMGVYTAEGNISYYKPMNFGTLKVVGADYSFYGDITKWLYSNSSLGGSYYCFDAQGAQRNQFSFYLSNYIQVKLSETVSVDIDNSYYSRNQFGVTKAADQYRLDLAVQKKLWQNKAIIRLAIQDVFDTQRDKNTSYYDQFQVAFYQKRLTRTALISFIYSFKTKERFDNKNIEKGNTNSGRL